MERKRARGKPPKKPIQGMWDENQDLNPAELDLELVTNSTIAITSTRHLKLIGGVAVFVCRE